MQGLAEALARDPLAFGEEEFQVFGGRGSEGAIVISRTDAPVDFARMLAWRVANIVPVDTLETAVQSVDSYTQTIGLYPEALKDALRDRLAFEGAQRLVSLGGAATLMQIPAPQHGIKSARRMVKRITDDCAAPKMMEAQAVPAALQPA